jgi:hypothetical protein
MKIKLLVPLLLLSCYSFSAPDITDEIANAVKSGNSKSISSYFTDNIDLKVLQQEDVYSKAQAELIVKDFFAKHTVKTFDIDHKSAKNDTQFAIGKLDTSNGKFRVYFLLKKSSGKLRIQQFRIEQEND